MDIIDEQFPKQETVSADDPNKSGLSIHDEKFEVKVDGSSLDPDDWSAFRTLAYNMVDQSMFQFRSRCVTY